MNVLDDADACQYLDLTISGGCDDAPLGVMHHVRRKQACFLADDDQTPVLVALWSTIDGISNWRIGTARFAVSANKRTVAMLAALLDESDRLIRSDPLSIDTHIETIRDAAGYAMCCYGDLSHLDIVRGRASRAAERLSAGADSVTAALGYLLLTGAEPEFTDAMSKPIDLGALARARGEEIVGVWPLAKVEDDKRALAAEEAVTIGDVYLDFPPIHRDHEFVADAPAGKPSLRKKPAGPSITVIAEGALAHLPGIRTTTTSSSSWKSPNPRSLHGHLEGLAVPCVPAGDPRVVKDALDAKYPHARAVNHALAMELVGAPYSRNSPILLVSPPGAGKTSYAVDTAVLRGLPYLVVSAAGVADGSLGGTSSQWSTARVSTPLSVISREKVANPVIIIDEIDKAGTGTLNGNYIDTLLPFFEKASSRRIMDPFLECAVNLSGVSYILTANDIGKVSSVLRDRCRVIEMPLPQIEHVPVLARTMLAEIREERGLDARWIPDLDGLELEYVVDHWPVGSLRALRRLVEGALRARDAMMM